MRILLEDITLRVGGAEWFPHTTWEIGEGQSWAVCGPTGAGKTLLARALGRGVPLAGGRIRYFDGAFNPPGERSYVEPGDIAAFSAEAQAAFLRPYAAYAQARWQSFEGEDVPTLGELLPAGPRRDEVAASFGLEGLLERRALHLSNGESRRALLARLWLSDPRLLILDDPYAGLDASSRARLAAAVEALASHGRPQLLFLTSRPEEIPAGIEHVLWVEAGRLVQNLGRGFSRIDTDAPLAPLPHNGSPDSPLAPLPKGGRGDSLAAAARRYAASLAGDPITRAGELIGMDGVTIRYEGVEILKNVTWQVRPGERWLLSGPNGAGKSTLLSLVLGDNPQAYANPVRTFGVRRGAEGSIWEVKRRIGWVAPELQVYYPPDTPVREVVASGLFDSAGLYRRPSPQQAGQAAMWLEALEIEALAGRPLRLLSTGQQRLALLARTLVKHPPLLVLDEPCQGLDAPHRARILGLIDRLCALAPLTLVYVSHDPSEIPQAITHRLRLEGGRVAA